VFSPFLLDLLLATSSAHETAEPSEFNKRRVRTVGKVAKTVYSA
jgi:hypothetical protein